MGARSLAQVSTKHFVSINPATGETRREYEQDSDSAVEHKLQLALDSFHLYRKISFAERARMMNRVAEILVADKDTFGRMMTEEMAKPIVAAVQEAEKCAFGCRYYAENAEKFLADEEVKTNATRSFVRYRP